MTTHDHDHYRELAALALYDELDPAEREQLDHHLAACAGCRTFDAHLRATLEPLRSARRLAPDLPRGWMERLSARTRTRPARRAWLTAAASFAAGVLITWAFAQTAPPAPERAPTAPATRSDPTDEPTFARETPPPPARSRGRLGLTRIRPN